MRPGKEMKNVSERSLELDVAIKAARAAGKLLRDQLGAPRQIRHKGAIDLVTEMDHQAEELISEMLRAAFPTYGLLAEEGGARFVSEQAQWVVDPLDGTTNYAHGYPFFAVSIALEKEGRLMVGVVYNPVLDELFAAERGQGATLNGQLIYVSSTHSLGQSLLASGFPYDAWTNEVNNSREWNRFLKRVSSLRSDGSAGLDLCYVAAGRLDGFWELDLSPWDIAAGALIIQEAGGAVTQVNGDPFDLYAGNLLASNGHLHAEMLAVLRES
jgi:myo-inositol-1(or 4)-monophosphatase